MQNKNVYMYVIGRPTRFPVQDEESQAEPARSDSPAKEGGV